MDLRRFDAGAAFARRAAPFLLQHEAEHNVLLGICASLRGRPAPAPARGAPPYLATVEDAGAVVAVAFRAPPRKLLLSRTAAPDPAPAAALVTGDLAAVDPALPAALGPAAVSRAFAGEWTRRTGRAARRALALRIYALDAVTPPRATPGALRRATHADRDLVVAWVLAFHRELGEGDDRRAAERLAEAHLTEVGAAGPASALYLWEDGWPVSMAAAGGATPHGIRIYLVYTPPEHRRRGYASAGVAALSRAMLDAGRRFCFLYTDLANPTTNRIYQQIGYRPVGDADEYAFAPPPGPAPADRPTTAGPPGHR
jgi:predicted GNAT family acetyltransferase